MSSFSQAFIPYGRQTISEADITAVESVLRSPFLTQGPAIPAFEQAVADKVDSRYAVAVNSATSALHIACLALGLGPGDRLWTTPITFVSSANCGRYCGAEVDFVDINPFTGLMDVEALEVKLKIADLEGKLPKILIPVHLTGASCDMESINRLAIQYGFYVIEDASHAIGGVYRDRAVGSCAFSQICVFSFHPVKIITSGEGGMATTNDTCLHEKMKTLRSHGITKDSDSFVFSAPGAWYYEQQQLGFNYRMTDIHAALGLSQLERLDEFVEARNIIYKQYSDTLSSAPLSLLQIPENVLSSVHLVVIQLNQGVRHLHAVLFNHLSANNVGVQLHYYPVHLQPYYQGLGFRPGDYPAAELYSSQSFSIPVHPGLSKNQIEYISNLVLKFFDEN